MRFQMTSFHLAAKACLAGALLMWSACSSAEDISIRDGDSALLAVRASIHPKRWNRNPRVQHGLEVGYEGYNAKDTQTLSAGERLELDALFGPRINGPATLNHKYTSRRLHVAYAPVLSFGSNFELEPLVGLAHDNVEVVVHQVGVGNVMEIDSSQTSVIAGVTPRWRFNDALAAEARLSFIGGWGSSGNGTEVALVWSPHPNLAVRVGYASRHEKLDWLFDFAPEIDVRAHGPMASLQFKF